MRRSRSFRGGRAGTFTQFLPAHSNCDGGSFSRARHITAARLTVMKWPSHQCNVAWSRAKAIAFKSNGSRLMRSAALLRAEAGCPNSGPAVPEKQRIDVSDPGDLEMNLRRTCLSLRSGPHQPVGFVSILRKMIQDCRYRRPELARPDGGLAQPVCVSPERRISELVADSSGAGSSHAGFRGEGAAGGSKADCVSDDRRP